VTEWVSSEEIAGAVAGQTVTTKFRDTVAARPDAVALRCRQGDGWVDWTYREYADRATRLAAALRALGVKRGQRVVVMMRNRPEFHVADVAALLCGATPVSIYNSSSPEQVAYLAAHSEAEVAIVEDTGYLERFLKARGELPNLREIAILDDPDGLAGDDVRIWSHLLAEHAPVDLDEAAQVAQPEDLATLIYTSGTTGPPKGVMLSHFNIVWTAESYRRTIGRDIVGKRVVSYLPMAHIAERMSSHYLGLMQGYEVTTCPEAGHVGEYLRQVHPEIFFGVPRIWEKLHAGIQQAILSGPAAQREEFERALLARGPELAEMGRFILGLIGLDQCEIAVTGAAPISKEVLEFFLALGLPLSEIYGMSESSGPMTWEPFDVRVGTVGRRMPGIDVQLLDDGEVVCRGGNVFQGYFKEPEKTKEALDADAWLHSGDIGQFDDDGYLSIVDRKKELIITAGGKNISPANIESALKSYPLIGQVCAIGDNRPFVSALIVLDQELAPAWAKSRSIAFTSLADLAANDEIRAEVQRSVDEANKRFSQVERVKKFSLLPDEWVPDSEELTPTMKLKRRGIHTKYAAEIEALYVR
jgi:long-chain acyl-CoA synthetase